MSPTEQLHDRLLETAGLAAFAVTEGRRGSILCRKSRPRQEHGRAFRVCPRIRVDAESVRRSSVGGFRGLWQARRRRTTVRARIPDVERRTIPPSPSATTLADALRNRFLNGAAAKGRDRRRVSRSGPSPDAEHEIRMVNFLRERYARARPHVVMPTRQRCAASSRSSTAMRSRREFRLFCGRTGGSRCVVAAATRRDRDNDSFDRNLTSTLDLAERLQPGARHLIVVAGSSIADRTWHSIARRVVEAREESSRRRICSIVRSMNSWPKLSRAPRDAIVVLLTIFADSTGKSFVPVEVRRTLAAHSSAPAYTPYVNAIGSGLRRRVQPDPGIGGKRGCGHRARDS